MRYGSVCSGIEAATQAWHPLGWSPEFFSEIEPFPCKVLAHRYPSIANHGDMTKFEDWPGHAIDLLAGGTPCQSFSVAGLRGGLDDARGNLMLTYAAIARKYRPRWLVWENVPGVLSSDGGRDFASLLGLLSGRRVEVPAGGWRNAGIVEGYKGAYGLAWRIVDAQYCRVDGLERAVPQRRRRVFVVGYLGDWRRAAAVLLERESMCGNSAPRRQAGKRVAHTIASRPTGGGGLGTDFDCDGGLIIVDEWPASVAPTLDTYYGDKMGLEDQHIFNQRGGKFVPAIAFGWQNSSSQGDGVSTEVVPTLDKSKTPAILTSAVRRLTPRECERLQGFPDDFTNIPWRNKPTAPDGPRYKALGNSMAVNVMRWIGQRIEQVDAIREAA